MKKYLTQRTVNVIAIASAVAWGLCAVTTLSRPNNRFSSLEAQAAWNDQMTANKFLDHELGRLRHCGELAQRGIYFNPQSRSSWICQDVIVGDNPYVQMGEAYTYEVD